MQHACRVVSDVLTTDASGVIDVAMVWTIAVTTRMKKIVRFLK